MKPALQFGTREHAEQTGVLLKREYIKYEITPIEPGGTYPKFVNVKAGGFLLSIEEARWEEGMGKILDEELEE